MCIDRYDLNVGDMILLQYDAHGEENCLVILDSKVEKIDSYSIEKIQKLYCLNSYGFFCTVRRRLGHMHGVLSMSRSVTFQKL